MINKTRNGSGYDPSKSAIRLKLMGDRVLIDNLPSETEKMDSGIFKPGTSKEKYLVGTVVAIGPGYPDLPVDVKVGEKVRYNKLGYMDFYFKDNDDKDRVYHLLRNMDIISVL